jgi:Trypsin
MTTMKRSIGVMFTVALASCILLAVLAAVASEHSAGIDHNDIRRGRQLRYGQELLDATAEDLNGIVGGSIQETTISYFVRIDDPVFCGGMLIAEDIVLSAAHCFYNDSTREVVFPTSVRIAPLGEEDGMEVGVDVDKSLIHPDWFGEWYNLHYCTAC